MPFMTVGRFTLALLLVVTLILGGCGQKGPLTLGTPQPEPPDTLTGTPSTDAEQEEKSSNDDS
jgi:predicted small lipoprotein YifL